MNDEQSWCETTPARLRRILGSFCSGVTVIAATSDGKPVGLALQSFMSLSLDPPLVAFSPSRKSKTYPLIRQARRLCINILAQDHKDICNRFAQSGTDKWSGVEWLHSPNGSPLIEGVSAWIDCQIEVEHAAGDHHIAIAQITALENYDRAPLVFFRSKFCKAVDLD